ncbi:hypothetical protein TNCV_2408191 [Trichonephila clavipes]|nr:hypothetical protein TNCV_2408191 [Trichonephila clavipes]
MTFARVNKSVLEAPSEVYHGPLGGVPHSSRSAGVGMSGALHSAVGPGTLPDRACSISHDLRKGEQKVKLD